MERSESRSYTTPTVPLAGENEKGMGQRPILNPFSDYVGFSNRFFKRNSTADLISGVRELCW